MLRKVCAFVVFACVSGNVFANTMPQVVTSEVFEDTDQNEYVVKQTETVRAYEDKQEQRGSGDVPTWPLAGSEADFEIACDTGDCEPAGTETKVRSEVIIENTVAVNGSEWSGGPNISNGPMIPAGFDYECANNAEMPLLRREMMEDDGGYVLAMSRSSRKNCNRQADSYALFAERAGFSEKNSGDDVICVNGGNCSEREVAVDDDAEDKGPALQDQVRSWVVAEGSTLRNVLQSWCDKAGWDLVWTTSREYPIEASAVFKGRFVDVASALVRNFERATPIPYAKFYKGNRVVVVSTTEE